MSIRELIIQRTLRVPAPEGPAGDGSAATRQFDAALMSAGFKLSGALFAHLSQLSTGTVMDTAVEVLGVARKMLGDHRQHNVYFRDFPRNIPDTIEFWTECLVEALANPVTVQQIAGDTHVFGTLNLLSLPAYGRYRHSYADMLAAHTEFIEGAGDRVTVLELGCGEFHESNTLYLRMAAATTPGNEEDREALRALARECAPHGRQPEDIPVRENRALINQARVDIGVPPLLGTVTDALRLACALSDGDVTLVQPTRFRSFPRSIRRVILSALDDVVRGNRAALGDVNRYAEQWKRLGERLHVGEYDEFLNAHLVFAVARGDLVARSTASHVEELMAKGAPAGAAFLLQKSAPGVLHRSADWLLRSATPDVQQIIAHRITEAAPQVSGRVLLSLRDHLANRDAPRVFVSQSARGHVGQARPPIASQVIADLETALDSHIRERLSGPRWVIDPAMSDVAVPISGKSIAGGFGTLPRGSTTLIPAQNLRFFIYWKQRSQCTDFDLSALMLDRNFRYSEQLSWTNLRAAGGCHSGDITSAPDGASEFIDLDLSRVQSDVIIPQVNIYSGESFTEVEESFFGWMLREPSQEGKPFEARTVRMKSELRGEGRVALPLAFVREGDGWRVVWLHLHLNGSPTFNQVEANGSTTTSIVRAILGRDYLSVGDLGRLVGAEFGEPPTEGEPVTYIGMERPEKLPDGSVVITAANLGDLIPK